MDWIAVESSQISHLGYEPEAEYPLGVKFHPSKKQQAAGQPATYTSMPTLELRCSRHLSGPRV